MRLEYTPEQEQLRDEIRATMQQVMTPQRQAAVSERVEGGPAVRECVQALAAADLLGVGWPKEFGGLGFSAIGQFFFAEEARRVNAPIPLVTLNTVGPTLMHYGTDEQKQQFLPAILDGSVEFAIGYSEPGAGSDLASLRTTAVRDGSGPDADYLINGQLNFERAALGNLGALEPLFEQTLQWARNTELDGGRVIDKPWVQQALARVEAEVAAYKLINLRVNTAMTKGVLDMGAASAAKVFGTELAPLVARRLLEVLDHNGLRRGADAPLRGALESAYRVAVISTFGGGANEIQRDIIAMAGLGMPRAPLDLRATTQCATEKSGGSTQ